MHVFWLGNSVQGSSPKRTRRGINKGLKSGAHLTSGLNHIVELRPLVIQVPHPCLDLSVVGGQCSSSLRAKGSFDVECCPWGKSKCPPNRSTPHNPGLNRSLPRIAHRIGLARNHRPGVAASSLAWSTHMHSLISRTVLLCDVKTRSLAFRALLAHGQPIPAALLHSPL